MLGRVEMAAVAADVFDECPRPVSEQPYRCGQRHPEHNTCDIDPSNAHVVIVMTLARSGDIRTLAQLSGMAPGMAACRQLESFQDLARRMVAFVDETTHQGFAPTPT